MRERPSGTALAVTGGLLLDAYDPALEPLFPGGMRELAEACVAEFPRGPRVLRMLSRGWYRSLMRGVERVTVRGIFLHYLMRKLFIEDAVRAVLRPAPDSPRQLVILGAGLDTLGARLALDPSGPIERVIEVDHPATQAVKRRALAKPGRSSSRLSFVELDLTAGSLTDALRASPAFVENQPAVFVAEGLLMYLTPERVTGFFAELRGLAAAGSEIVFTFMESALPDRIRFKNLPRWYAPMLDFWLRRLGEPMHWATPRAELGRFLAISGWALDVIADRDTFRQRYLAPHGLQARELIDGEYVAVARRS